MRRLTHLIVLVAFVLSCGGHWYVLQGVAWIKMIHEYSQTETLAHAVTMTLSGEYPCEICKAITEKKKAETDQLCAPDKVDKFFPPAISTPGLSRVTDIHYAAHAVSYQPRVETPPVPPPRTFPA